LAERLRRLFFRVAYGTFQMFDAALVFGLEGGSVQGGEQVVVGKAGEGMGDGFEIGDL
jgi:hypothetical protein